MNKISPLVLVGLAMMAGCIDLRTGLACETDDDCGGAFCRGGRCEDESGPVGEQWCGAGPACSGASDTCVAGECRCGTGTACSGTTDRCVAGVCQCGTGPACSGTSDACLEGACTVEWANWSVPPEAPTGYSSGPDTVTDNVTGLVWQQTVPSANFEWTDAKQYCAGLSLAGGGWRLPAVIELLSIVDSSESFPAINGSAFPSTPTNTYWSSTPYAGDRSNGNAWAVDFHSGDSMALLPWNNLGVRCVR